MQNKILDLDFIIFQIKSLFDSAIYLNHQNLSIKLPIKEKKYGNA